VAAAPALSITLTPYDVEPAAPLMTALLTTAPVLPCTVTAAFTGVFWPRTVKPSRTVAAATVAAKKTPRRSWSRMRVMQVGRRGQLVPICW